MNLSTGLYFLDTSTHGQLSLQVKGRKNADNDYVYTGVLTKNGGQELADITFKSYDHADIIILKSSNPDVNSIFGTVKSLPAKK